MSKFKPIRKNYRLKFTGDLEGLEVRASSVPMGRFLALTKLAAGFEEAGDDLSAEQLESLGDLMRGFAQALISWNITDDEDEDVPANLAGLETLEFDMVLRLVAAWIEAIAQVSGPLVQTSTGGAPSLVDTIPMETASPSRVS